MRYFEYVYIIGAILIAIFLATEFQNLDQTMRLTLLGATVLFAFMFSFRRQQRLKFERKIGKAMKDLEEKESEEG